jgi:PIN domain nuclease of toxin-antitoxin system
MLNKVVFDSSAFIALLAKEKSYSFLRSHLKNAIISAVSLADVYKYCIEEQNLTKDDCLKLTELSGLKVIEFCNEQALISAYIISQTKPYGLSLGDRACLALALYKKSPIVTCDKIWERVKLNVEIFIAS